jgi:hypothetical protein
MSGKVGVNQEVELLERDPRLGGEVHVVEVGVQYLYLRAGERVVDPAFENA